MALADRHIRRPGELSRTASTATGSTTMGSTTVGSTATRSNHVSTADGSSVRHATIVDIDTLAPIPREGLTRQNPSMEDLTERGAAQIMNEAKQHRVGLRWIHLRANCMEWVQDVLTKVCEERGISMAESAENPPVKKNPLLRKDLWADLFHGKASDQVHSRFMVPTCIQFSTRVEDEASDSTGAPGGSRENLVLYLPYLHWEAYDSWRERQELLQSVLENKPGKPHPDRFFVAKYLRHATSPFHDRRSLQQAYYHDYGMTRSVAEGDQVMQRYTARTQPGSGKMIVIDQLWLWVIKGTGAGEEGEGISQPDLVITAFPDRFDGAYDSADVHRGIIEHLERGLQPPLKTAHHLVAAIIEHCTGVFFQRQLDHDKWFIEFFAAAIGDVRSSQKAAFRSFCSKSRELKDLEDDGASLVETARKLEDPAFSISEETSLVRDIKDIIDELGSIDYILHRQQDVVASLTRVQTSRSLKTVADMVKERRETWASIRDTAKVAYDEIKTQMDVKQKQANLYEARSSRHQASLLSLPAQDSARYGRTILLLTVVTIIFLPLSFLATWFGMNIKDPNAGSLTLYQIAAIIFPISMLIALVALVLAFSQRLRRFVLEGSEFVRDFFVEVVMGGDRAGERKRRRARRGRRRRTEREDEMEVGIGLGVQRGGG